MPFYVGNVGRVNYKKGIGTIRTSSGKNVPFVRPFVEFLDGRQVEDLRPGMQVGFDVGWTSRGLRITKIKFF